MDPAEVDDEMRCKALKIRSVPFSAARTNSSRCATSSRRWANCSPTKLAMLLHWKPLRLGAGGSRSICLPFVVFLFTNLGPKFFIELRKQEIDRCSVDDGQF